MNSVVFGIFLGLGIIAIIFLRTFLTHIRVVGLSRSIIPFQLTRAHRKLLQKYFRFYRKLSPPIRKEFDKRLVRFIQSKVFVPRSMKKVTAEMKVCISATAIQLTFGLPDVYLSHFQYILVYPDQYYSAINRQFHKGEVNPRHKAIVLSWKSFVEGYAFEEGINLGLHEMAHALHLENAIRNGEFDFLPQDGLRKWDELSSKEIEKIKMGSNSFFRSYGAVDPFEFFAVAVENFFERPYEFREYSEQLYASLVKVLNQDPLVQRS